MRSLLIMVMVLVVGACGKKEDAPGKPAEPGAAAPATPPPPAKKTADECARGVAIAERAPMAREAFVNGLALCSDLMKSALEAEAARVKGKPEEAAVKTALDTVAKVDSKPAEAALSACLALIRKGAAAERKDKCKTADAEVEKTLAAFTAARTALDAAKLPPAEVKDVNELATKALDGWKAVARGGTLERVSGELDGCD
jgi:hypothetical protein